MGILYVRPALRHWAAPGLALAGGGGLTFLLRDDFTTTEAAPVASPRTALPGPGTLTLVDSGNHLSVASGQLTHTNSVGSGDPRVRGASMSRLAGRSVLGKLTSNAGRNRVGFVNSTAADGNDAGGLEINASAVFFASGGAAPASFVTISNGVEYAWAVVQRTSGNFAFIKGGAYTEWTLAWVDNLETSATIYPSVRAISTSSSQQYNTLRVLDLPAPFDTDFGLATQRLAGSVAAGTTFTHEANCVIEWTQTTAPTAATRINIRVQDASNYWRITVDGVGNLALFEVVADIATQRATAVAGIIDGHRIVVVADGTTIRGYSNNVLRWTYSSASNFATATAGIRNNTVGTENGVVSDLVSWPRTLTGAAATVLDAAVA